MCKKLTTNPKVYFLSNALLNTVETFVVTLPATIKIQNK